MSKFSEVKCFKKTGLGNLLANGTFLYDGVLKVNFALIKGKDGPFVALPQTTYQKDGKTEYKKEVSLINAEVIKELNGLVMAIYDKGGTPSKFSASGDIKGVTAAGGVSGQMHGGVIDDDLPF